MTNSSSWALNRWTLFVYSKQTSFNSCWWFELHIFSLIHKTSDIISTSIVKSNRKTKRGPCGVIWMFIRMTNGSTRTPNRKFFARFWWLTCKDSHNNKLHVNWHAQSRFWHVMWLGRVKTNRGKNVDDEGTQAEPSWFLNCIEICALKIYITLCSSKWIAMRKKFIIMNQVRFVLRSVRNDLD